MPATVHDGAVFFGVENRLHFDPDGTDDPVAVVEDRQTIPSSFHRQLSDIREGQRHNPLYRSGEFQHIARIPTGVARLWRQLYGFDLWEATNEEIVTFLAGLDGHEKLIVSPHGL